MLVNKEQTQIYFCHIFQNYNKKLWPGTKLCFSLGETSNYNFKIGD